MIIITSIFMFLGVFTILSGLLYFTWFVIHRIEHDDAESAVEQVHNIIEYESYFLSNSVADWSYWDDTVAFIHGVDDNYYETNLQAQTLVTLQIDFMVFYSLNGNVFYSLAVDDDEEIYPVSEAILTQVTALGIPGNTHRDFSVSGIINTSQGPLLIASQPILQTNLEGDVEGQLVFGRFYDDQSNEMLETIIQSQLIFIPNEGRLDNEDISVKTVDRDTIRVVARFVTLNDDHSYIFQLIIPRNHLQAVATIVIWIGVFLVLSFFVMVAIVMGMFHRNFTMRVVNLVGEIKEASKAGYAGSSVSLDIYEDEITELRAELNELIHSLNERNREAHRLAYYDDLTGLPNRNKIVEIADHIISHMTEGDMLHALYFNIKSFSNLNNSYGEKFGDQVLIEVAGIITDVVCDKTRIARVYADQFVILLFNVDTQKAREAAQKLIGRFARAIVINSIPLRLHISIGIASAPEFGLNAEELLKAAASALEEVEKNSGSGYLLYDDQLRLRFNEKEAILIALKNALTEDQFRLVYQPKVDTLTNRIIGIEALLRWEHPQLGNVSPARFIPIAEEHGLIVEIGEWVLERAARDAVKLSAIADMPVPVSVNVSARQFFGGELIHQVLRTIKRVRIKPQLLELELTESILIGDLDMLKEHLLKLRNIGTPISIDDFGTGYSSLAVIDELPIDIIKIDSAFIWNIGDSQSEKIIAHIIQLAQDLQLGIIAEGVETENQMVFLRAHGCHLIQGYLYYRPMSFSEIEVLFRAHFLND
jgi:diguanylate cyclase (GGDEF)-like protein